MEELEGTARVLESFGCLGGVNIDLSITCDTEYYNGLVFKGYVPGAPSAVLSGGRYDSLMRKLGKEEQAIGFAVKSSRMRLPVKPLAPITSIFFLVIDSVVK